MTHNVGARDRWTRVLVALALLSCTVTAPLPFAARLLAFGLPAGYLALSALAGTCIGYTLMGKSTCARPGRDRATPA